MYYCVTCSRVTLLNYVEWLHALVCSIGSSGHLDGGVGQAMAQPGKQPWLKETLSVDSLRKLSTLEDSRSRHRSTKISDTLITILLYSFGFLLLLRKSLRCIQDPHGLEFATIADNKVFVNCRGQNLVRCWFPNRWWRWQRFRSWLRKNRGRVLENVLRSIV